MQPSWCSRCQWPGPCPSPPISRGRVGWPTPLWAPSLGSGQRPVPVRSSRTSANSSRSMWMMSSSHLIICCRSVIMESFIVRVGGVCVPLLPPRAPLCCPRVRWRPSNSRHGALCPNQANAWFTLTADNDLQLLFSGLVEGNSPGFNGVRLWGTPTHHACGKAPSRGPSTWAPRERHP